MYALTRYYGVNMHSSLKEKFNIAWTPAATTDHIPIIALPCSHLTVLIYVITQYIWLLKITLYVFH